jgi:hypothetical protein
MYMVDFQENRRSLIMLGLGASTVAGSAGLLNSSAPEHVASGLPSGTLPSVADFGASGDGVRDDTDAFQRALRQNAGAVVTAPFRPEGYRLTMPVVVPQKTELRFLGEDQQLVTRVHSGDMFVMESGARIIGGNYHGGFYAGEGSAFRFDPGTGQQSLARFQATQGWTNSILRYLGDGGSQSRVSSFSVSCTPGLHQSFAITMQGGKTTLACPRHFSFGEFNGAPSFNFESCCIVLIDNVYCGPLAFTDSSRGVMISNTRVGNQRRLDIRGNDHILIAGWTPRLYLNPGADNCYISGFFNSGYVRDISGNGRNVVTYWEHEVEIKPKSDSRPLVPLKPLQAGISRSGATYLYRFGLLLDMRQVGTGLLYLDLPDGVATSAGTDQWGTGMLQMQGENRLEELTLRVLPGGERRTIAVYSNGVPLGARPGLARLSGSVSFTA